VDREAELRRSSELADAELGVAEDLSWWLAIATATATHLAWGGWFATVLVFGVTYYGATVRYRSKAARAQEAYYRFAGLGAYSGRWQQKDPESKEN
jgi:hypothetical protein